MSSSFRISITVFLWLASSVLLLVFFAVELNHLGGMDEISGKATEVRERNLPEIVENQRSFTNIESLRRIAEVVYVTDDPQRRRAARIDAQSMAAESVFLRDDEFHERSLHIAKLISELARDRDLGHELGLHLKRLAKDYSRAILSMSAYIPNIQAMQEIFQAYFATSLPLAGPAGVSQSKITELEELAGVDSKTMAFIQEQCEYYSVLYSALGPVCARLGEISADYAATRRSFLDNAVRAKEHWESVDAALREMRDNVGTDSEFVVTDALTAIERTAKEAQANSFILFAAGSGIFVLYLLLLHWFIVRPVRWTGHKLLDIQKGRLQSSMPSIRITEMYNVARLLDLFSGHLAELYSHASRLEEDAAEKRDLEELMRAVFQVSLDGYCVWGDGQLKMVNQGLLRLLGLPDITAVKESREAVGFTPQTELERIYAEVLEQGVYRKELHMRTAAGESLPCEVTYLPVHIQGKVCVLSYFRDIREQKRTERELRDAKEAAEVAAREKSDFLARMSHEIRTPMNGVLGLTQVALSMNPPPEQKGYLEKIQASARILLGVINDILDFSRIERGGVSLESVRFSLNRMLGTVVDLFRNQAEQKGLFFSVTLDKRTPDILQGDELRLSQVLLNLCGNAVKFTNKGGVRLLVDLLEEDEHKVLLRFTVSDTGVGMTKKQMGGLFQPFAQADTSTTRKYGGSGLGLVISKSLVEMMQGHIDVESAPAKGSVFSFVIPLQKGTQGKAAARMGASGGKNNDLLRGRRVLLAEDNEINQEIAVAFLESLGITVLVASNGEEALRLLEEHTVDGVLMDIQMPHMDGLTASHLIRENGRDPVRNVPIIAMTAHAMWEDKEKSFAAGMNDHITKPIDIDELRNKLIRWIL